MIISKCLNVLSMVYIEYILNIDSATTISVFLNHDWKHFLNWFLMCRTLIVVGFCAAYWPRKLFASLFFYIVVKLLIYLLTNWINWILNWNSFKNPLSEIFYRNLKCDSSHLSIMLCTLTSWYANMHIPSRNFTNIRLHV